MVNIMAKSKPVISFLAIVVILSFSFLFSTTHAFAATNSGTSQVGTSSVLSPSYVVGGGGSSCSGWRYTNFNTDGSYAGVCSYHEGNTMITDWEVSTTWPMSFCQVGFTWSDGHSITVNRYPSGSDFESGEEEHTFSSSGSKSIKLNGYVEGYNDEVGIFGISDYETVGS